MKHSWYILLCTLAALSPLARAVSPVYAATDFGPFKSVDGGVTWKNLTLPGSTQAIQTMMVDPAKPSTVYAWGAAQFFKSTDAGQTWTAFNKPNYLLDSGPYTFAIDPVSTNVMYTYSTLNGVVQSTDSGVTWSQLTILKPPRSGAGATPLQPGLFNVFTDPTISGVVYVIGPNDLAFGGMGYLLKSADFGSTWSILSQGLEFGGGLYIDPKNGQIMYGSNQRGVFGSTCSNSPTAGMDCGLYKSTDGGQTWVGLALP